MPDVTPNPLHGPLRAAARLAAAGTLMLAGCTPAPPQAPAPPPVPVTAPASPVKAPPPASRRPQRRPAVQVDHAALRRQRAQTARLINARADTTQADAAQANGAQGAAATPALAVAYYAAIERRLLAAGKLRAGDDGDMTAAALARDFRDIALRDEYSRQGQDLVPGQQVSPLRRWAQPVRIDVTFGDSFSTNARTRDRTLVAETAAVIAKAARHPVTTVAAGGNFHVLFLTDAERRAAAPLLKRLMPDLPAGDVSAMLDLDPGNYCTVFAYSRGGAATYDSAVALIRAELPPRLRTACVHEELAQGMGLANDSDAARPSVFNDNDDYALLTRHDLLLLAMLYDPRLSPGMTEAGAMPIVQTIAAGLAAAP